MKNLLRYLGSFVAPLVLGFVLPYLIVCFEHQSLIPSVAASVGLLAIGFVISVVGLMLLITTVGMFILIGNGTIMPWDPTTHLIVVGLYGYVRNPMILSLLILQVGEAVLFTSYGIAMLAVLLFAINTVYFTYFEEPGLEKRFGAEYIEYKKNVPMWIPRLKPWRPAQSKPM